MLLQPHNVEETLFGVEFTKLIMTVLDCAYSLGQWIRKSIGLVPQNRDDQRSTLSQPSSVNIAIYTGLKCSKLFSTKLTIEIAARIYANQSSACLYCFR